MVISVDFRQFGILHAILEEERYTVDRMIDYLSVSLSFVADAQMLKLHIDYLTKEQQRIYKKIKLVEVIEYLLRKVSSDADDSLREVLRVLAETDKWKE